MCGQPIITYNWAMHRLYGYAHQWIGILPIQSSLDLYFQTTAVIYDSFKCKRIAQTPYKG